MSIGFTTSVAFGSRDVCPDKGMTKVTQPKVLLAAFGDGYEQRLVDGINNLAQGFQVSFANRTKEEIDDIIGYLNSLGGTTAFTLTIPDSNNGGEINIQVVSEQASQIYTHDDYYTGSASFRRVYEA